MKHHISKGLSLKSMKGLAVLSLLLAFQPTFGQTPTPADHIKTNKFATYNYETGQGVITLESYVTGETEKKPFLNPTDIVLVLDVSHSMCPFNVGDSNKYETVGERVFLFGGDMIDYLHKGTSDTNDIIPGTSTDAATYKKNHDYKSEITIPNTKGGTSTTTMRYTVQIGGTGTYYNLAYFVNGTKYGGSDYPGGSGGGTTWSTTTGWYYGTSTTPSQSGSGDSARWKPYSPDADDKIYTDVKLDLLENACRSLIDVIYENPPKEGTSHRISVVTWAQKTTYVTNLGLTAATEANKATLYSNVTHLKTTAQTWPAVGLDQAKTNLGTSDRNKMVLFLTDGEPNDKYANILTSAKKLKDGGAKIFSVALVSDETMNASRWNSESTRTIKEYLELVSSLYPTAQSFSNTGTKNDDGLPYYQWSTGADLADAFKEIGMSISGGADVTDMDASDKVSLVDNINNNYCELTGVDPSLIKVYTAVCTGKDGSVLTFDPKVEVDRVTYPDSLTVTVAASATPQSVKVEGFDYSKNWCGYDAKTEAYHGQKLIIEIPFKMKAPGSATVTSASTNASGSSLYRDTEAIEGTIFTSPTIPFTEITIQKTGLKSGESGVFIVKKDGVEITRIILTGTSDSGTMVSTKLRHLDPDAVYTVTEAGWDYTYTTTSSSTVGKVFSFTSSKKSGMDNTAEGVKINDFK